MNVTCSACQTQYKIDETKVPAGGGFIRCKACGERVRIPSPGEVAAAAGAPIPLAGSAPAPVPTPASVAKPGAAIPLAGSTPAAAPVSKLGAAIPLAGSVSAATPAAAPKPGAPIPLAGSAPAPAAAPRPGAPIPLAGSAPAPAAAPRPGAPIPLAGSMPAPAPTPGGAIPLAGSAADDAPTRISEPPWSRSAGAIPLAGSRDDDTTQITDTPRFLDSLPAAPMPTPIARPEPTDLPAPAAPDTQLDSAALPNLDADLPMADDAALEDLPTPVGDAVPVISDLPTPVAPDLATTLSDLPTPVVADVATTIPDLPTPALDLGSAAADASERTVSGVYTDLPTGVRPEPTDLPMVDEAPRLMEDLPIADQTLLTEGMPGPTPADAAPAAAAPAAAAGTAVAPVVDTALGPDDKTRPAAEKPKRSRKGLVIGLSAGGVALLAVAALAALGTPYLGVQQFDPLGLTKVDVTTPPGTGTPTRTPDGTPTKSPDGTPAKTPKVTPTPTPPPPPRSVPVLSAENVDSLRWTDLTAATATFAKTAAEDDQAAQGLVKWAQFRMARIYGDEAAKAALVHAAGEKPAIPKLDGLGAAGMVGSLALAGKLPAARKLGEGLQKAKFKAVPQLAFALATTYDRRPDLLKGIKQCERALKLAPMMRDAAFLRATLQLGTKDKEAGARELAEIITKDSAPELAVRTAVPLIAAGMVTNLDDVVAGLEDLAQADSVPPSQRPIFLKLLVRKKLRFGDLDGALLAATERVKLEPMSDEAIIELGRLTAATGGDPVEVLKKQSAEALDVDRARFLAERVRLLLRKNDVDGAKKLLATATDLDPREAGGWLKLAEGWIAVKEARPPAAKAAFAAAAKGRPKFAQARLAQTLVAAEKPGVLLKKLSDLNKAGDLPEATLELARVMQSRGNPGGASALLDLVLWTDPTLSEPVELVLEWSDTLDRSGQQNRAEEVVKRLHDARPDDPRPVHQLIAMTRRGKRWDAAIEWYRLLVTTNPKDARLKVGMAEVLNDAGKRTEAQGVLDELFKTTPTAKDPDSLAQLARAWMGRDDYKAKELFDESLRLKPQAKTYMLQGEFQEKRGKTEEAETAYKKAIELEPDLTDASLSLARMAIERRSFPQAAAALEAVLKQNPQHARAAELLGDTFTELNKPREAVARYELALTAGGENATILMKVAKLQIDALSQTDEAQKTLRRAIRADQKVAEPHYYLGLALKDNNQRTEAKNELEAYLRLAPEGENAGDAKRAIADLEKP